MRSRPLVLAIAGAACAALAGGIALHAWAAGSYSTVPDGQPGDKGRYDSLALDAFGNPVISYYDATYGRLKVAHCNDALCEGGDEAVSVPDSSPAVGQYTSMVLDAPGRPVVSYYDQANGDLKVLHCNDANCLGGDESIASPDTGGDAGRHTSLAIDASGRPVISYYDASNGNLKVMRCDDANCAGASETISTPDALGNVGQYTSIVLDGSGRPVVSYYDATQKRMKLLHCNDIACAGNDDSVVAPDPAAIDAGGTSIMLDAAGFPVIAYFEETNGALRIVHCNDPDCIANNESISVSDSTGRVGLYPSIALDASGYPVVSYYNASGGDLKVMHCNDANCTGGDEAVTAPQVTGDAGLYTSIALTAPGDPVVSFYDASNSTLRVLSCNDPACATGKDVGGVTELSGASDAGDRATYTRAGVAFVVIAALALARVRPRRAT